MEREKNIAALDEKIGELRRTAEEIAVLGQDIEAVKRNIARILASTRMLEINVSDVRGMI